MSEVTDMRRAFVGWQCRVRQQSMRTHGGKPTPGMRPKLLLPQDGQGSRVTVLIHKAATGEIAAQFRHMAKKTHNPPDRYDAAVAFLGAEYYQDPDSFRDELTAVYALDSAFARQQENAEECVLIFQQTSQRYVVPCRTALVGRDHELYSASYWHNFLFNPALPGRVSVVSYTPQWERVEYEEN